MFGTHLSRLGSVHRLGLVHKAIGILRKYGTDAHIYLPGVGTVSGITAGNYLDSAGTTAASVDNPVGKVTDGFGGLHATQATTANKPILRRGLLNLIAYSDDQSNAAWSKTDTSPTPGQIGASGLTTATLLTEGSAGSAFTVITGTSVPAGSPITERIRLKRGNTDIVRIDLLDSGSSNGAQCWVNLATRTILSTIAVGTGSGVSSEIDSGENGYYWLTLRATPSAISTATRLGICSASANSSYTRVAGATYYIDRAGILQGTYTAQQILDAGGIPLTTTAAASNANAGRYSWQFDGVNDSLSLSAPLFQMSDDHCVIAGFSTTTTASGTIAAPSTTAGVSNGRVCRLAIGSGNAYAYWSDSVGISSQLNSSAINVNTPYVAAARKVSNARILRMNGIQAATDSTVLGSTTSNTGTIGAINVVSVADYFSGSIYPVIAIKGTVSDADLLTLERFVGQLSGVSI